MRASAIAGLPPIVELAQGADFITARADDGSVWVLQLGRHPLLAPLIDIRRLASDANIACGLTGSKKIVCAMFAGPEAPPSWWANAKIVSGKWDAEVRELTLNGEYIDLTLGKDALCVLTVGGEVDCIGMATPETFSGLVFHNKTLTRVPDLATLEALNLFHRSSCWRTRGQVVHCAHGHPTVIADVYLPDVGNYPDWSLRPSVLADGTTPIEAASADGFACVKHADQSIRCMGFAEYDKLPLRDGPQASTRQVVAGIADAVGLHVGATSTCVRRSSGKVSCWGWGAVHSAKPVELPDLEGAIDVAVGAREICALLPDGHVRCRWITGRSVVTKDVSGFADAVQVEGDEHFCARTKSGAVWCWAPIPTKNSDAQVGAHVGGWEQVVLYEVPDVHALDLVVYDRQSCVVTTDHHARCWGDRMYLLDSLDPSWLAPVPGVVDAVALGGEKCVHLATGNWSCVAQLRDDVDSGLDDGFSHPPPAPAKFHIAVPWTGMTAVTMQFTGTCGLNASGDALCDYYDTSYANHHFEFHAVRAIGSGRDHVCVLHHNGTVACAGSDVLGQRGDGQMGMLVDFSK